MKMVKTLMAAAMLAGCQAWAFAFTEKVAFNYGGTAFTSDAPVKSETVDRAVRNTYRTKDGKLALVVTIRNHPAYEAVEYLPELVSLAKEPTEIVDSLRSFDFTVDAPNGATIRTLRGSACNEQDFTPVSTRLVPGGATSVTYGSIGRSSDGDNGGVVPYLGIDLSSTEGYELAVGWTGSWKADFKLQNGKLAIAGGLRETHFRMLPGERLRTPSVLLFKRSGMTARAHRTIIHRFMRDFKSPRDARGKLIPPLHPLTSGGGNKSAKTMIKHIDWAVKQGIHFNAFWVDAGWNGPAHQPDQTTNCGNMWFKYRGTWTFNPTVHPAGSLAAVADRARAAGMKMLLWVEPETMDNGSVLKTTHPEWCIGSLLNLGDPAACDWAIETITGIIKQNHLECYRQDFNQNPQGAWNSLDTPERKGVAEMKYIAGLYRFWDTLRARFPNLLIDNCSSGGRRLDFETSSRAHSYCRTDYAIGNRGAAQISSMQTITHNLLTYWPFQGSETRPANLNDNYSFFSTIATGGVFTPTDWGCFVTRMPTAEENIWFKSTNAQVNQMQPYFLGDYYPLTDPVGSDEKCWCAWQFDRPDLGEGVICVFRRPGAPGTYLKLELGGIDPRARYLVTHADDRTETIFGSTLRRYSVWLPDPRGYALLFYKKLP